MVTDHDATTFVVVDGLGGDDSAGCTTSDLAVDVSVELSRLEDRN